MGITAPNGYHTALLKISGEALAGDRGFGLDGSRSLDSS